MELLKSLSSTPELMKEIYGDIAKPGAVKVGEALATVIGLGNTALLPVTMLNEVARIKFQKNLERYREKMDSIEPDDVQGVAPEVGVPIMEKLMYVSDDTLVDMYTELLSNASSKKRCHVAHPSFANIINNLSPEEARLLNDILQHGGVPFIEVKLTQDGGGYRVIEKTYCKYANGDIVDKIDNISAYLSNLEGLGILKIRHDIVVHNAALYENLESDYKSRFGVIDELKKTKDQIESAEEFDDKAKLLDELNKNIFKVEEAIDKIDFNRGKVEITPFGSLFLKACTAKS